VWGRKTARAECVLGLVQPARSNVQSIKRLLREKDKKIQLLRGGRVGHDEAYRSQDCWKTRGDSERIRDSAQVMVGWMARRVTTWSEHEELSCAAL
jgi:hypothetical protein